MNKNRSIDCKNRVYIKKCSRNGLVLRIFKHLRMHIYFFFINLSRLFVYLFMEQEFIAKTFMGLENVLANELQALGAKDVVAGRRVVTFKGNKELLYRANFQLRTAIRILKPIKKFKARSAEEMYDAVKAIDWSEYIKPGKTFSVDSVVYSEEFRNARFVTYKVKDAIVDQFREKSGNRPNISVSNPDIQLHIHISESDATLSLDSSGESLHRRGYRQETVQAPINEVLAAGIILQTGWHGECDFIDPMCGSGTFLIEAALIAHNMSPGLFRKEYAFEKWDDFDKELFDEIYNDDSQEREFEHHIYGYDIDSSAIQKATLNVRAAGLAKDITLQVQDFKDFVQPKEKSIIVTNPPYGERITTPNLLATYQMIGERLKHQFTGNDAWILSYREECFDQIGLKPSIRIPLYNGSLECELRRYTLFDGKMKDFRSEGGVVKTDAEKKAMAEKRRFKQNRAFKERLEEQERNEESDLRDFQFLSFKYHDQAEAILRRQERKKNLKHRDSEEADDKPDPHRNNRYSRPQKGKSRRANGEKSKNFHDKPYKRNNNKTRSKN